MAHKVLINGAWKDSAGTSTFQAVNPVTEQPIEGDYPVSPWDEIETAIEAAAEASRQMRGWSGDRFAAFLDRYAERIEGRADELVDLANQETALPVSPRLKDVELPRTTNQLRQAASAALSGTWTCPTIDTATGIRAMYGPIGPVAVFGPNNFPYAFNSVAGGDFAAAVAAGNPVIAKGHSSHPGTTRILTEEAFEASRETEMPQAFVQLIYRTSHDDGCRLVGHPLTGACGYTGSRSAGLKLKESADKAGNPIYLELSSINPVVILPGALAEKGDALADEFSGSCLMGTGQFCTNPGLVLLVAGDSTEQFISTVAERFSAAPIGTMLSAGVSRSFAEGVAALQAAGATILTGGESGGGNGFSHQNTLLRADGAAFISKPEELQAEAFGNGSLIVVADTVEQLGECIESLEGNLTGCVYTDSNGADDAAYDAIAPGLRTKVGRLLNDKMPTGVAVSAAMNHGGPFPATGHPTFTAVGMPTSIFRYSMLQSYDNVRSHRLPSLLRDENANSDCWRCIDGEWTHADVCVG